LRSAEYALLVGLLKAPSRYNPIREPERAQARRDTVLAVMHAANVLTDEELEQEGSSSLLTGTVKQYGANASYIDTVKQELIKQYDSTDLQTGGLRVFTYYNPVIQAQVQSSTEISFKQLSTRFGETNTTPEKLEVALVLAEPNTGSVVAMMGGRNARYAGFNRALDAKRQVGSLLKPAVYLTAWQQPNRYSLASIVADEEITMPMQDGSTWQPKNLNGETNGDVIALEALSRSLNLAAIDLGMKVGIEEVVNTLEKLGLGSNISLNPSLLLGAHEFSVFEMAQMYQTIAADGFHAPLRTIREVVDTQGNVLSEYPIDVQQQFDLNSIYLLKYALATSMFSGTGQSRLSGGWKNRYIQ